MASTPSASALSAVLRCRGNLWTRNPPTKRPATSVYSLGLAGGAVRDSPAERSRSNQASAGEAFLQGERVVVGRRLTVEYKSDVQVLREKDSREFNKLSHPKLSQSTGCAHSGVQNALVRQLARTLTSNLPGTDKCAQLIHMIRYEPCAAHVCKTISAQEIPKSQKVPAGVVKVSITSPCFTESAGQISSFVLTGWTTLKSTCLSWTALVSEFMFLKLGGLCRSRSGPDDATQHLLGDKSIQNEALQTNGQIHSPTDLISTSSSGQRITEDRPD